MADRKGRCPDCYLPPAECLGHEDDDETIVSDPMGVIIIEWPAGVPPVPWGVSIFDAVTGQQIKTCVNMELHGDPAALFTADLTLFADEDGKPVYDGKPVAAGPDEILTGVFSFEVAEMRVRPKPFDEHAAEALAVAKPDAADPFADKTAQRGG